VDVWVRGTVVVLWVDVWVIGTAVVLWVDVWVRGNAVVIVGGCVGKRYCCYCG